MRDDSGTIVYQELNNNKEIETMDENKENNDTATAEKELELISKFSTLQRPPQRRNLQARRPSTTKSAIITENYEIVDNTKIEGSLELVKSFEMFYHLLALSSQTNEKNEKSDNSESIIDAIDKGDYQSTKTDTASQGFVDEEILSDKCDQVEGKRPIGTKENISAPSYPMIIQIILPSSVV